MVRTSDAIRTASTKQLKAQPTLADLNIQFIGLTSDTLSTPGDVRKLTFTEYSNSYYIASGSISAPSSNTEPVTVIVFSNVFVAGMVSLSIPAGQYLELVDCFIDRIQLSAASTGSVNYIFSMSIVPKTQADLIRPKVFLKQ